MASRALHCHPTTTCVCHTRRQTHRQTVKHLRPPGRGLTRRRSLRYAKSPRSSWGEEGPPRKQWL
eukprot:54796-Eustigmatos_ZCMA.PRE.1